MLTPLSPLSVPVTNLREQAADRMAHHPSTLHNIFPLLTNQQTTSHMRKSALVQTDYHTIPSWHYKFHQQSHQCLSFLTQKTWVHWVVILFRILQSWTVIVLNLYLSCLCQCSIQESRPCFLGLLWYFLLSWLRSSVVAFSVSHEKAWESNHWWYYLDQLVVPVCQVSPS